MVVFNRLLPALMLMVVWSTPIVPAIADGQLKVSIRDSDGGMIAARAWVEAAGERFFHPDAPETATPYRQDRSFSCDGEFTMKLPSGTAMIHVEKGKEYLPVDVEVDVADDQTAEKTVVLQRWINMPENGWYSADLHVHLGHDDARVLKQLALADDVHLVPAFTYWLRGRGETWHAQWPDGTYNDPIRVDGEHLVTRNNIEIERIARDAEPGGTIGATFLFNLQQPVTTVLYGEHFPTDVALCRIARRHSPDVVLDSDKPSWAETVVGAALGMLDTIQLCHNHYYRDSTGPGGYGMIGPLAAGESNAAIGDGLFHRTNSLYYRFLNCGFRLGVSGGSAIGVKAMPAGHHRLYARIDGPLESGKMWAAIKGGRTFATTGPILTLTAGQHHLGDTISIAPGEPLELATMVRSVERIEALQLVHNGVVIASEEFRGEPQPFLEGRVAASVRPSRSGWVAARALYRAPDGLLRQAHTSPIYLELADKPAAFASDARYMLRWIDRLRAIALRNSDRFPSDGIQQAVLTNYAEASAVYERVIVEAQDLWGDL